MISVAGSPIASREVTSKPCVAQLLAALGEIGAVVAHLLRLSQLEIVEVTGGEAVCDVHEQQPCLGQPGEPHDVLEDGFVGLRVLDGDEDVLIHVRPRRTERTSGTAGRR